MLRFRALLNLLWDWCNPANASRGLRWIHVHIAVIFAILIGIGIGVSGVLTVQRIQAHGGFQPPATPPRTVKLAGSVPPASWSLQQYRVRYHNQGSMNSCVNQTLSEATEIWNAERGHRVAVSGGWNWNRVNGGGNNPVTYQAVFDTAIQSGDPPLSQYGNDGASVAYAPPLNAAAPYHLRQYVFLAPSDRLSIEREIRAGRPVAMAMPWLSSLVNKTDCSVVYQQFGTFEFWHSTLIDAYSPIGVHIEQSWPGWGCNQGAWLSWQFLAASQYDPTVAQGFSSAIVAALIPTESVRHPFPGKAWWAWLDGHQRAHPANLAYKRNGKLTPAAKVWWKHYTRLHGVKRADWYGRTRTRRHGFMRWGFRYGVLYYWPGLHASKITYARGH